MDAVERRDVTPESKRPRTESERRADLRSAKRAEALRANLKRRKSQTKARAEAQQDLPPEAGGTAGSPG